MRQVLYKNHIKILSRTPHKPLALILLLSFFNLLVFQSVGYSLPTGINIQSGDVTVDSSQQDKLTITASDKAIINFDSFSIAQNEIVQFIQPNESASVLSRVTGSMHSDIYGSLFANGQLVFINPNGMTFHETANIDVGSLIVSTLDIQNSMYLDNELSFEKLNGFDPSEILNKANIAVNQGGHIVLLSESIHNQGTLEAYAGNIAIGSANKATISFDEHGFINLVIDEPLAEKLDSQAHILNQGDITANGGKVLLTAQTLNQTMDVIINNTGTIEATHAEQRDGRIVFLSNGVVENNSDLTTSSVEIDEDTVFNADHSYIRIDQDWLNNGIFNGQNSTVEFTGSFKTHQLTGDNIFNNLNAFGARKYIRVEPGTTQTILGDFNVKGEYANFVFFYSAIDHESFYMDVQGDYDLQYMGTRDSHQISGEDVLVVKANGGWNHSGWILDPDWVGDGGDNNWSTDANWDGGTAPSGGETITFNGTAGGSPDKDSTQDINGLSVASMTVSSNYSGTITLSEDTIVTGNFALGGGTFNGGSNDLQVEGNWTHSGGTFDGGTGSVTFTNGGVNIAFTASNGNNSTTFNDLNVESLGGNAVVITGGDEIVVEGTYTNSGANVNGASGSLTVEGDVVFTGSGVLGSADLTFEGSENQSLTVPDAAGLSSGFIINKSGGTVTPTANIDMDGQDIEIQGGTFALSTFTVTDVANFTLSGGTFNGGSGNMDWDTNFTHSGGTFTPGTSTITFDTACGCTRTFTASNGDDKTTFYDFVLNATGGTTLSITAGDTLEISNDTTLTDGSIGGTGTFGAQGNVSWVNTFDGGSNALTLTGGGNQVLTQTSQTNFGSGGITVNKTGGTVTLAGDVDLGGSAPFVVSGGTFNLGTNTLDNIDDFTMSGGTFNSSTGSDMTVLDTFNLSSGTFNAPATLEVGDDWTHSGGTFDANGGTVTFTNGGVNITFTASNGNNKTTFNNLNVASLGGNAVVLTTGDDIVVTGTYTNSGASVNDAGGTGNLIVEGDVVFTASGNLGNAELNFEGSADQSLTIADGASLADKIVINKSGGTVTPTANIDMDDQDIEIQAGTFALSTFTITDVSDFTLSGGTFNGGSGNMDWETSFTHSGGTFTAGTSTITFDTACGCTRTFTASNGNNTTDFYNFVINAQGGSTLSVTNGDSLGTTGTLTATDGSANNGTYNNQGNVTINSGYDGGNSAFQFTGTATQTWTVSGTSFNNAVTINKGGGSVQLAQATTVDVPSFTITSGTFDLNGQDITFTTPRTISNDGIVLLEGDETVTDMNNDTNSGLVKYDGPTGSSSLGFGVNYYDIEFDSSGQSFVAHMSIDVNGDLTITNGTFDAGNGSYTHTIGENWTNNGTFTANNSTITFDGTAHTITGSSTFNNFSHSDTTNNSTDTTLTFDNTATQTVTGNLTLAGIDSNDEVNLVSDSTGNQWGLTCSSCAMTIDYVNVKDSDASGGDTITYTNIINSGNNTNWGFSTVTWDGSTDTDWNTGANWDTGTVPGANDEIVIADVSNDPILDTNRSMASLTINSGGVLDSGGFNLTVTGALSNNGTVIIDGDETISIGTMDTDSGLIRYDGALSQTGLAFGDNYYDLELQNGGLTLTLNAALDVNGDLTISNGSLVDDGNSINVGENWTNTASYTGTGTVIFDGSGAQSLNSGGTAVQNDFNDLTINKSGGTLTLTTNDLDVDGTLTLTAGTFDTNGNGVTVATEYQQDGGTFTGSTGNHSLALFDLNSGTFTSTSGTLTVTDDWDSSDGGTFTHNSGTVVSSKNGNTTFELNSSVTFNNFTFNPDNDGNSLDINTGDTIIVEGTFTLSEGEVNGPGNFEARGNVSMGANFDGGSNDPVDILFTGTAATQTFTVASGFDLDQDIIINKSSGQVNLGANMTLDNGTDITITDGTFDLSGFNLNMGGARTLVNNDNFQLQGGETITNLTQDADSGSVTYDGTGTYGSLAAGNTYFDLIVSGTGSFTASAALDVNDDFTLSNGTFVAPATNMNVAQDFTMNSGTFTHNSGTLIFDDSSKTSDFNVPSSIGLNNLTINTANKAVNFGSGDVYTIDGTFTATGTAGNNVVLNRLGGSGTDQWTINPTAFSVNNVTVTNSKNSSGTDITPVTATDGGNNCGWFGVACPGSNNNNTNDDNAEEIEEINKANNSDDGAEEGGSDAGGEEAADEGGDGIVDEEDVEEVEEPLVVGDFKLAPKTPAWPKGRIVGKTEGAENSREESTETEVFVYEGAVDVSGFKVYDGESMVRHGKEGIPQLKIRGLYVTHIDGITVLRAKVHTPIKHIALTDQASGLSQDSKSGEVYFTIPRRNTFAAISSETFKVRKKIRGLDGSPEDVIMHPTEKKAFVTNSGADSIQVLDIDSRKIVETYKTGSLPSKLAITNTGQYLFVTNRLDKTITKIDTTTGEEVATFKAGLSPFGVTVSKDNQQLFVTDTAQNKVLVIDASTHQIIGDIKVGESPHSIELGPLGEKLFVSNQGSDDLSIIDIASRKELSKVKVGDRPQGIAITPEGDKVYVANVLSGNLHLININTRELIEKIPVGSAPTGVVLTSPAKAPPGGNKLMTKAWKDHEDKNV